MIAPQPGKLFTPTYYKDRYIKDLPGGWLSRLKLCNDDMLLFLVMIMLMRQGQLSYRTEASIYGNCFVTSTKVNSLKNKSHFPEGLKKATIPMSILVIS